MKKIIASIASIIGLSIGVFSGLVALILFSWVLVFLFAVPFREDQRLISTMFIGGGGSVALSLAMCRPACLCGKWRWYVIVLIVLGIAAALHGMFVLNMPSHHPKLSIFLGLLIAAGLYRLWVAYQDWA